MSAVQRLAWHETLEIHELVAMQSIGLIKLKKSISEVQDAELRSLYAQTIQALEGNVRELLAFYPKAAIPPAERKEKSPETGIYAGELLSMAKNLVRNYAIAVTEAATPALREVLTRQLNAAIRLHGNAFYFMYQRDYYPAYNLEKLLANDVRIAEMALSL